MKEYALNFYAGKIRFNDIPEDIRNNIDFVQYQRKNKLSKTINKGYDVIRDIFFVNEEYYRQISSDYKESITHEHIFDSFIDMYNFVDGKNIYQNACYYQCTEQRLELESLPLSLRKKIKLKKILIDCAATSFKKENIKDVIEELMPLQTEELLAKTQELHNWIDILYLKINSPNDFIQAYNEFQEKYMFDEDIILFVITNLIERDKDIDFLKLYYQCKSNGICFQRGFIDYILWSKYKPSDIMQHYQYDNFFSIKTQQKHKKEMEYFLQTIQDKIPQITKKYFEEKIGQYVIEYKFAESLYGFKYEYFDNFKDFALACNNDLSNANLKNASDISIDVSKYITNAHTRLPQKREDLAIRIEKEFLEKSHNPFRVVVHLENKTGEIFKSKKIIFKYFFDFLAFLNKDLSNANLLLCDGLINLNNADSINFQNAKIQSSCAKKINLTYTRNPYKLIQPSNDEIKQNEENTLDVLQQTRDELMDGEINNLIYQQSLAINSSKIYYISDLHLLHRISNRKCESYDDVLHLLIKIAQQICPIGTEVLIIAGDVSSDFDLYKTFIEILKKYCHARKIFFVLGNHEMWNFKDINIDAIVDQYKTVLQQYGMCLLHNNMFVYNDNYTWSEITQDKLLQCSREELDKNITHHRLILFGGTGFAGFNETFNANCGIYRDTINRQQEVFESAQFCSVYEKVLPILKHSNSIIATHMPKQDWSGNQKYESNIIYISGHTHRNFFFDDNVTRIYADNQVGYKNDVVISKYFYVDTECDWFNKYTDGIYEITREDYNNFYRGKNIRMTCTRELNILYMLKRNGYYCFIHKNKSGKLSMFSGGALKGLENDDINYYYNNMQSMIDTINEPLTQYSNIQKNISCVIKHLGGSGEIHGCIVDIDFFNHIYVNPVDGTIRAYYAEDIVRKLIYPSVPQLLENQCPTLHNTYLKLLASGNNHITQILQTKNDIKPVLYLDTDIYIASRIIKKMQRVESQILTYWDDKALEKHKKKIASNNHLLLE